MIDCNNNIIIAIQLSCHVSAIIHRLYGSSDTVAIPYEDPQ